jgi:hypothetical protein
MQADPALRKYFQERGSFAVQDNIDISKAFSKIARENNAL